MNSRHLGGGDDVGVGSVQDFTPSSPTGKLKTWKPDMLPGVPARQDFSFSEFQVFTPHAVPENLAR